MDVQRPTWQHLPRHFKNDVARLLDGRSRLSLSLCSKSDYETASNVPSYIASFFFSKIAPSLRIIECGVENDSVAYHKLSYETAISNFLNLVKHPKSKIQSLHVPITDDYDTFYAALAADLEAKKYKIHTEEVTFHGNFSNFQGPLVLKLLKYVDPETLKILNFDAIPSDMFLEHLMKMEQWKKLNGVNMNVEKLKNGKLNDFFHLNQLVLKGFKNRNDDNKAKIIENFKTKDASTPYSFFIVSSRNLSMAIDARTIIEEHNLPAPGVTLHVEITKNEVRGRVVKNGEDLPFIQLLSQMRS